MCLHIITFQWLNVIAYMRIVQRSVRGSFCDTTTISRPCVKNMKFQEKFKKTQNFDVLENVDFIKNHFCVLRILRMVWGKIKNRK